MELIELNVPVVRDENGYWDNPHIPDFDEDHEAYKAWLATQHIETTYAYLEAESPDHPAYVAHFDNEEPGCQLWNPEPVGDGWHTFFIGCTEDGPVWVWARRVGREWKRSAA